MKKVVAAVVSMGTLLMIAVLIVAGPGPALRLLILIALALVALLGVGFLGLLAGIDLRTPWIRRRFVGTDRWKLGDEDGTDTASQSRF
ncbi:hypothetical protein [Nocardia sp. NPDC003345]